jgi:hypothetical protein
MRVSRREPTSSSPHDQPSQIFHARNGIVKELHRALPFSLRNNRSINQALPLIENLIEPRRRASCCDAMFVNNLAASESVAFWCRSTDTLGKAAGKSHLFSHRDTIVAEWVLSAVLERSGDNL